MGVKRVYVGVSSGYLLYVGLHITRIIGRIILQDVDKNNKNYH